MCSQNQSHNHYFAHGYYAICHVSYLHGYPRDSPSATILTAFNKCSKPKQIFLGKRCQTLVDTSNGSPKQQTPENNKNQTLCQGANLFIACSAGVFFGCANVFVLEGPCWNSRREEEMGRVKGSGEGGGEALLKRGALKGGPSSYPKGYYFYSPQSSSVIKSKMGATTIR